MEAPTLVLVPPTPLRFDIPKAQQRQARSNSRRDSSDAIFSIYSMYGDEQNPRASTSWTSVPAGSSKHDRVAPDDDNRMSSLSYENSDLAYYSPEPDGTGMGASPRASLATNSSPRPPSSYATPPSLRAPSDLFEDPRLASARTSDTSTSSYTPGPSNSRRSRSPHSKRSSQSSSEQQDRSLRNLPPLPPSTHPTPSPTPPPRQPSPAGLLTPKTSMKFQWKHPLPVSSPSSKVSLVPSEGEDMDGFHVRNTYAQLEVSGVKGDGYEEGVERTRARVGTSRASQLQAEAALGDGHEKKRDLDSKEIQVLQSVDRYVHWLQNLYIFGLNRLIDMVSTQLLPMTGSFCSIPPPCSRSFALRRPGHPPLLQMQQPLMLCHLSQYLSRKPLAFPNGHECSYRRNRNLAGT